MLGKLLKYDLRKNMRWMWILFVATLALAGVSRGVGELGKNSTFFKVLKIFLDTVTYAMVANCIIQPFIRSFMNFTKSLYGDESYLTHTLPVTKSKIITSKYLTALIETVLGYVCAVCSLLILFVTPTFFDTIKMMLSMIIVGDFSIGLMIVLLLSEVLVEFLMFLSIIFFSIILGYRFNEKKALKSFLFTALFAICVSNVMSIIMLGVLLGNGINSEQTAHT